MNNAVTIQSKLPDVCSYDKNQYVSLSLTNRKSSVHLHALYSPRITLRTFTPRRDQLVICGQYILRRQNERDVGHIKVSLYLCKWRRNPHRFSERLLFRIRQWDQELKYAKHGEVKCSHKVVVVEWYQCKKTRDLECAEVKMLPCSRFRRYSCVREAQGHVETWRDMHVTVGYVTLIGWASWHCRVWGQSDQMQILLSFVMSVTAFIYF
jgi:hypothetical protein